MNAPTPVESLSPALLAKVRKYSNGKVLAAYRKFEPDDGFISSVLSKSMEGAEAHEDIKFLNVTDYFNFRQPPERYPMEGREGYIFVGYLDPKSGSILAEAPDTGWTPKHKQVPIRVHGVVHFVDDGIKDLIFTLNASGIETFSSCECDNGTGYVRFGGQHAKTFMSCLLAEMLKGDFFITTAITFEYDPKADTSLPRSCKVSWKPEDYSTVLDLVCAAVQHITETNNASSPVA
jgi:hypothetical protein